MDPGESDHNLSDDIPYNQSLNLRQVFHLCHSYITLLRKFPEAETILSHIDAVDETLQWVSSQFCSSQNIPASCSLMLILILQEVYELLRRYADSECLTSSEQSTSPTKFLPHGHVFMSLEKLAEERDLPAKEKEIIEEYMFHIQKDIHQATTSTVSTLRKLIVAVELWSDQLAALTLHCYPRYTEGLKDSTQMALGDIKRLFNGSWTSG